LVFGDNNPGFFVGFVNHNLSDLGWTKGLSDVFDSVVAEDDDINLFLLTNFAHNGINAGAVTTNKGADRVDARNGVGHSQLGADAGFAGHALDFDGAVVHFGHFGAEQPFNKFFGAAG